jgi:uncharacterized protein (TIGR00725 family)
MKKDDIDLKHKIAVSGAAVTSHCPREALEQAEAIGRAIAEAGCILVTGATTGAPYWAAKGAKTAGGTVIGISPASSVAHHVKTYHLPLDFHDLIIYTGFGYSGRNLLLTRSAEAVITLCGRTGTLNEFTDAFEDGKIQGILLGAGGTTDLIPEIMEKAKRGTGGIIFEADPKTLVTKVVQALDEAERELMRNA